MAAAIRMARPEDAAAMLAIYAPVVRDTAISFELEPPTLSDFTQRIHETLALRPWLVCEAGDDIAGYVYAGAHRARAAYGWSVEPSIYVDPRFRRKGVAQALYRSLFALLRLQGFYNAYAGITLPNEPSVALHRAFGFGPVGVYRAVGYKFGQWHDVSWWQYALQEHRSGTVALPRSPAALDGEERWREAMLAGRSSLRL